MIKRIIPALILFVSTSCSKNEETTHPVEEKITESVYASGMIKSKNQYQVFATSNALIKEIYVEEGSVIKKGDVICSLSNEKALLNTAAARIAGEYASLKSNKDILAQIGLDIATANAKMENDASLLKKQQNLWEDGIGTENELQQKKLNFTNSTNQFNALKFKYNQIEKQLNLQAKQSQTTIELANSTSEDYLVKSAFDGKVYAIYKKKGEMATTQSPIALVGASNAFIIDMQVDEYDITRIQVGQKIKVLMDSYKGQLFDATIIKVNPIMNTSTKSFTIEASFIKPPTTLYPNLTVEANIIINVKERAITVPRDYIINNEYILLKNKEKRKVTIGLKDYQKVEILKGITTTDEIVKPNV